MARLTFNYDTLLFTGPLTDRKIAAYKKAGYYGPVQPYQAQAIRNEKRNKITQARRVTNVERKKMLSEYD